MKIFTTSQIADLDKYTIANEPIEPIDLMERASLQLTDWISANFDNNQRFAVCAGPGNNGGDALAVARLLAEKDYFIEVFIPDFGRGSSDCFFENRNRLKDRVSVTTIDNEKQFPELLYFDLIIDGLFGSGLTRPLTGFPAHLVKYLNNSGLPIIAIDIPSGLMGEDNRENDPEAIIQATYTLTLQFPKLSFFLRENERFTGRWEVLPIGLHPLGIEMLATQWNYSDRESIVPILKLRGKFSHKGTFGHALLAAGSFGKVGAAILAAKGCLRSGAGLLTVHLPGIGNQIMQSALPEAMLSIDKSENVISDIPLLSGYKAIGIGPGIGKSPQTVGTFRELLTKCQVPLVIDADALNILSEHPEMLELLPPESVLTPHPVEFERLAGKAATDFERLTLARSFARNHHIILILKGAYTAIAFPDGNCWFNTTGNPGMGTGGSGDILTGILTGLLAQRYSAREAAVLGVYLHGLSGDLALMGSSEEALIASDIADHLGMAFSVLKNDQQVGITKKKSPF